MTVARPRHIPVSVSSFVGREAEMAAVTDALSTRRLVTLVGPPGVGKTRLAAEVAGAIAANFADGAVWVDLASVHEPDAVVTAVARAIGAAEGAGSAGLENVIARLEDRQTLVILDNCEHLVADASAVVQALLERCPRLRVLATSRQPLDLSGELRHAVGPLGLPEDRQGSPVEAVAASESGQLFTARATSIDGGFAVSTDNAAALAAICRRLDGIPLAIELAAARVAVLSVQQIARELDNRFALLGRAHRPIGSRHQTIEETIDWSHELLTPAERVLFRRLGIFGSEFGLDAVHSVCLDNVVTQANLLDLMAALVAKSLVVANTRSDPARYRMLETIRTYAEDRLGASGEGPESAGRLADWCLAVVEAAEPNLTGPQQAAWLAKLDTEHPHIQAALNWTLRVPGGPIAALRMSSALVLYWRVRNRFHEGLFYLDAALKSAPDAPDPVRAKALWSAGMLAVMAYRLREAEAYLDESMTLAQAIDDKALQARVFLLRGNVGRVTVRTGTRHDLERSIALATAAGDQWCLSHAYGLLGSHLMERGEVAEATINLERGTRAATDGGDGQGLAMCLILSGELARRQGDFDVAGPLLERGLEAARELAEPYATAAALMALGRICVAVGDHAAAREHLQGALDMSRGDLDGRTQSSLGLFELALAEGRLADARWHFDKLVLHVDGVMTRGSMLRRAQLAAAEGDGTTAEGLLEDLTSVREPGADPWATFEALHTLALVARSAGRFQDAETLHLRAIDIGDRLGNVPGLVASLECLGGLLVAGDWPAPGARLMAATDVVRSARGWGRRPADEHGYQADLAAARAALTPDAFAAEWKAGERLSMAQALNYALKGRGSLRVRPATGWESLTRAEQEVARLVAEGLTNAEIGERLFVSFHTAKKHVSAALAKLGVASRVELANELARRELLTGSK